jgi:hypothetical protein
MKTEVISFFSDIDNKTYYSDHAKRLAEQLKALGVPYDIRKKQSLGSYQKNCLSKPQFIYQILVEKQKPIIWLDIDSDVKRSLNIFDQFEGNTDLAVACSHPKLHAAKASPIYLGFNSNTLEFLQHWAFMAKQMMSSGKWFDHEALIGILHSFHQRENFKIKFIGPEYCVWPGTEDQNSVIIMGLADVDSKKEALKQLGMSEDLIEWQSPGTR